MRNRQTCTVCHLHLILPAVALVEVQTIKIIRQVVRRTGVQNPVRQLMEEDVDVELAARWS